MQKPNPNEVANQEFERSKTIDQATEQVPEGLYWTCEQVCEFFDRLNLSQYRETLMANQIDGRRLIYLDASHLPKIGVHDFEHIKVVYSKLVTRSVRELLKLNAPYWNRSISLTPREINELYLEAKSFKGTKSDKLNYEQFVKDTADSKWQPPLTNQGLILPRF